MASGKSIKWLAALLVVGNLVIVAVVFLGAGRAKPTLPPMPNPNGFDDFARAGRMLTGKPDDYANLSKENLSKENLKTFVSSNAAALKLVRLGLSREGQVPNDYSTQYITNYLTMRASFPYLLWTLCAEGRLAELENRTNGAVRSYLDAVRFAQESSRKGIILSKLAGIVWENLALSKLHPLIDNIDAGTCHEVVRTLEAVEAKEPPLTENLTQEEAWPRQSLGLWQRISLLWDYKSLEKIKSDFIKKFQTHQFQRRQIIIAFAARAYELEKGERPKTASDLVPGWLKAIPKDPVTGTNLVLTPP